MSLFVSLKNFLQQCGRVWVITKKPSSLEFKTVAKASAIGILAIGLVGFIVSMAIRFI
jgi:protein transport protein SEC61 subunit gamma-like protein